MATINLTITKAIFDAAVPAAKEPKGTIFAKLEDSINNNLEALANEVLGDVGIEVANNHTTGKLAVALMHMACIGAVLANLRNMDLVLTATGFGVVSTNDTAPASKMRVDALEAELWKVYYTKHYDILELLFKVSGWSDQDAQKPYPGSLFFHIRFLTQFAGIMAPTAKDWDAAQPVIQSADEYIVNHISFDFYEELVDELRSDSVSDQNIVVIYLIRKFIAAHIQGRADTADSIYKRLMNIIESDLDSYPTYRDSQAYEVNHFETFENEEDAGAYHFLG